MIINLLKTFYSLVFLNFKIAFLKFFFKKKIFFFYHPITHLTKIHTFYIEDLFNNIGKNIVVFFGCQPHDKIKLKLGRNYYFIKQGFLKWVFNVDIFISLNPCDVFTNNSIKIYIHHDIYDTPLAPKKKEKVLLTQLSKYDHILLSSKQTFTVFTELFKINLNLKKPLFHEAGYPRPGLFCSPTSQSIKNFFTPGCFLTKDIIPVYFEPISSNYKLFSIRIIKIKPFLSELCVGFCNLINRTISEC